eukprot:TRINITY_DN21691_c0_g1_i1.p1 TRINITY_DN21691_c0_g1~~TRINITY_DN21691_c0_g1_i1.p1  ORF type:complete len:359 (-),score=45.62 TRINITY_DN21691_c0_g1_i1:47-1123(-)
MFFLITSLIVTCLADQFEWKALQSMPTPRSDLSAITLNDALILTAGGCLSQACPADQSYCACQSVSSSLEAFYPSNNSWLALASLPRPRFRHGAAIIKSKMYIVGGRDVNDTLLTQVDVYDIPSNTWTTDASMTWAQATSDFVLVSSGVNLYAIGGYDSNYDSLNSTCVGNTLTGTWDCTSFSKMNEGRGDACGVMVGDEIYVAGGFSDVNFCNALDSLEVYNFETGKWTVESRLDYPRADSACAAVHGNFHVVGGEIKDQVQDCNKYDIPVPHTEYYLLSNLTWIEETPLPDSRFRFAGVACSGAVILIGGQGPVDPTTGIQPILGQVSILQDVPDVHVSTASILSLCLLSFTLVLL